MKYFAIAIFLLSSTLLNALTFKGSVTDAKTLLPLKGITVGIDELKIVTLTDSKGNFIFSNIHPGYYKIRFISINYGVKIISIRIKRDFIIDIELKKYQFNTKVISNKFIKIEGRYGTQHITYDNIKDLPMRGAGDSLHLLQTLPGIGGGFNFSSVPIIRGSNPIHDKYYIDDIPIDYPYHFIAALIPLFSSINEEIVERTEVIKGPYPLYFDDSIGSIINIKTKIPDEPGFHGKIILDPIPAVIPTLSFSLVPFKDLSILFAGRRTYLDPLLYLLNIEYENMMYIQDHYLKIAYNLFSNHKITFISMGADDSLTLKSLGSANEVNTRYMYQTEAIKWDYLFSKKLFLKTIFSVYRIEHYIKTSKMSFSYNPHQYRLNQILNYLYKDFYTKTGYELTYHRNGVTSSVDLNTIASLSEFLDGETNVSLNSPIKGTSFSIFSENGWSKKQYWANIGLKYKHYGPLSNNSFSFRTMFGKNVTKNSTIYAGTGIYHSHADPYFYIGEIFTNFDDNKAYNSVIGYKSKLYKYFTSQIEIYYSYFDNLNSRTGDIIHAGELKTLSQLNSYAVEKTGHTYGIELYLKGKYGPLYGWISYAYSVSKRDNKDGTMENYYSDFDQTHILKFVIASKFGKWTPSMIWHIYTPLPYTPTIDSTSSIGTNSPVTGGYNTGRDSLHHRIDLKLTYTTSNKTRYYIEFWNYYDNTKNYLFQKSFDTNNPYSSTNPESQSEYLNQFLWIGVELCF